MKRPTWKRLCLSLAQHLIAAAALIIVAELLLNSYFSVETVEGPKTYKIFPADTGREFEESELYHDLFQNAVSDILRLVVIREQLETRGSLDFSKKIDVTRYAAQIGVDKGCAVTVEYELDDIIKWGKSGVDYTNRVMSLQEFVNYYGFCLYPENFTLDEYGGLTFDAFYRVGDPEQTSPGEGDQPQGEEPNTSADFFEETGSGKSIDELKMLSEKLENYTQSQLEDMVFSYIMEKNLNDFSLSREDDGVLMVAVPMLIGRYAPVNGKKHLTGYVDNWVDYIYLQNNVDATVKTLTRNYQQYQVYNDVYRNESNIKYTVRMMTGAGITTFTNINVPEIQDWEDYNVTDFFSEFRRYLVYYPDRLVFEGNTILRESEIDDLISQSGYIFADTIHIWLAVDTSYAVEGDVFYEANAAYQKIIPNVNNFFAAILFLAAIWLALGIYLTVTAGQALDKDGKRVWYVNSFDRIWTEAFLALGAALAYGTVIGYRMILDMAAMAGGMLTETSGIQSTMFYRYSMFALYGVYVSLSVSLLWYSLVRRFKAGNLWINSIMRRACRELGSFVIMMLRHRSTVISMLLPYNLFLFANLVGIVAVYRLLEEYVPLALLLAAGMILLDGVVGILLFRRSAEHTEIVEGITRIRDGESDTQLDLEHLHGSSRELADAVNHIGEGIRKAVKTSMKDEQMKTDLITNVSHDIKTPLTSIINYVDLLKRLKIEEEPARGYIDILDGKAQRLKQLTDDLVEASKISSGNIELNQEKLNLTELVNQSIGEFSEKLDERGLLVVFEKNDVPSFIYADSRRMWRVMENLFNNIGKYAMEGTRVYIDISNMQGCVCATVKNISKQKMNIHPKELTERFIRGDSSRSTEGSGLGLFIAQSLVQAQGGSFEIVLDGDLFKVMLSFPEYDALTQNAAKNQGTENDA